MPDDLTARFPGLADGWARFDGPAGTQAVDTAIEAIAAYLSNGDNANTHGVFSASRATAELVAGARATVGRLLGGDPAGVVFGANMTTLVMAFTRSVGRTLGPGDEVVCTRLDHDANLTPWVLAAADRGATVRLAAFDAATGRLDPEAVTSLIGERTRWVAVTGASNAIGTIPDLAPIVAAAHAAGARVLVDGVHLVPHRPVDVATVGCDAVATSSYKWYGPHAGVLWVEPGLLESLDPYKVRPADDKGPGRFETGTPAFEAIAGLAAAARFLLDEGMDAVAAHERSVFAPLLDGLLAMDHVRVHGPTDLVDRTPTVAFTVDGLHPDQVAAALADRRIAVWSGDYYAVEAMRTLGLAETGGAVRAGVVRYTTAEDVDRLLEAVAGLRGA
jgi:cysteine desulfurase family protein (TIGR01976 family)